MSTKQAAQPKVVKRGSWAKHPAYAETQTVLGAFPLDIAVMETISEFATNSRATFWVMKSLGDECFWLYPDTPNEVQVLGATKLSAEIAGLVATGIVFSRLGQSRTVRHLADYVRETYPTATLQIIAELWD